MTSQQRLVAWLGSFLILMVIWRVYRPYLSTVLFDTPITDEPVTTGLFAGLGSLGVNFGNGILGSIAKTGATDTVHTAGGIAEWAVQHGLPA